MKLQPNTLSELKRWGIVLAGIVAMVIPFFLFVLQKSHLIYQMGDGQDPSFIRPALWIFPVVSLIAAIATAKAQYKASPLSQVIFWIILISLSVSLSVNYFIHGMTYSLGGKLRNNRCLANQKSIAQACLLYAEEHDGRFPTSKDLPAGLRIDERYWECWASGYMINGHLLGTPVADVRDPLGTLLTADGYSIPTYDNEEKIVVGLYATDINFHKEHTYNDQPCAFASFADGHVGMLYPPRPGKTYVLPERNAP